jgi:hypothetical protein
LLLKNAEQISAAYELIPLVGPTPADMVNDLVDVWAAINDAPLDQIQADPEEFSAARLLAFDSAMAARAQEVYRLLARRREDGALGRANRCLCRPASPGRPTLSGDD